MKKIKIVNCPCFNEQYQMCTSTKGLIACEFQENCLLKKIVKLCNYETNIKANPFNITRITLANEVLSKFEIEEVENE